MATEQIPEFPDLRALRRAYERQIATNTAIEAARRDLPGRPVRLKYGHACEREAGRAFMASLAEADPACRVCGCTTEDACWDEEHGPCSWVEDDLCSACAG